MRRVVPAGAEPPSTAEFGAEGWNALLDESVEATSSRAAFLMDEQGLVVAARGAVTADEAEVLGARLSLTMEQAERMSHQRGAAPAVIVQLEDGWLTGLRYAAGDDVAMTLGVIGPRPLLDAEREQVDRLFSSATTDRAT